MTGSYVPLVSKSKPSKLIPENQDDSNDQFKEKFDLLVIINRQTVPKATKVATVVKKILYILKKALDQRVFQIQPYLLPTPSFLYLHKKKRGAKKVRQKYLLAASGPIVTIKFGLILNPDHMMNTLDKGPSGDDPEAKAFIDFWGDKAQLRRFQEGTISESVIWPSQTMAERRGIIGRIINYILSTKLNIPKKYIRVIGAEMDCFLCPSKAPPRDYGTGEEKIGEITDIFDSLSKKLRNIQALPLGVSKIQCISPVYRGTEVFPPKSVKYLYPDGIYQVKEGCIAFKGSPRSHSPYIHPIDVVVGLEASGKWPSDLEAFRKTKTAFLIEISELLLKQYGIESKISLNYLDILFNGLDFRIHLGCNKELTLLRQSVNANGIVETVASKEADSLEKFTVHLPTIASAIRSVHTRFSAFSCASRLIKRWLSCHLLLEHVDEVALELIICHLFINPSPHTTPMAPMVVFLRFLKFMKLFSWQKRPLIINFNEELKQEEISEIKAHFEVRRQDLPIIFIATRYDKFNSIWTQEKPTAPILRRIMFLADRCHRYMLNQLDLSDKYDFESLFRTNCDIFDVTITLRKEVLPNFHLNFNFTRHKPEKDGDKVKQEVKSVQGFPIIGFDPIKFYIRELNEKFGEYAIFFHDSIGGFRIFVLWKPNVLDPKPLLFGDPKYFKSSETVSKHGKGCIILDVEKVLHDMKKLGEGIVLSLTANVEKWEKEYK